MMRNASRARPYSIRFLTFLCGYILCTIKCIAGLNNAEIVHYDMENGFPSNNVYMTLQDKKGFLWFATENGLVKYNGYSFRTFTTADGLPVNDIWKVYEDKKGRLLIFNSSNQFGYIYNDVYHSFHLPDSTIDGMIYANFYEYGDELYISYCRNRAEIAVIKDDVVRTIQFNTPNFYRAIFSKNKVWVFNYKTGLYSFNPYSKNNVLTKEKNFGFNLYTYLLRNVHRDAKDNSIYTSGINSPMLQKVDLENKTIKEFDLKSVGASDNEYIYVTYFIEDSLFVFTNKNIYNLTDDLELIRRDSAKNSLTTGIQISNRIADYNKNTWYSTNTEGVWSISGTPALLYKKTDIDYLDKADYITTLPGGDAYWWDKKKLIFYKIDSLKNIKKWFLPNIGFIQGCARHNGKLILGTSKSMYEFDERNGESKLVVDVYKDVFYKQKNNNNDYYSLNRKKITDSKKYAFFACEFTDCKNVNGQIFASTNFGILKDTFAGESLYARKYGTIKYRRIHYDSVNKFIWCYNSAHISSYSLTDGNFYNYGTLLSRYKIENISTILADKYGNIYCQYNNILFVYDLKKNRLRRLDGRINLQGVKISLADDRLFLAGPFGVACIYIDKDIFKTRYESIWINHGRKYYHQVLNIAAIGNDELWLQTEKGIYSFAKSKLEDEHAEGPFSNDFFRDVLIYPGYRLLAVNDTINTLPGNYQINFNTINYNGAGQLHYSYKISGVDPAWKYNNSGEVYFAGLEAGKYYKLLYKVKDDFWESSEKTYYIYCTPYWYQTSLWKLIFWGCGVLVSVTLIILIILITRYYVAKENEKKRALTELELRAVHAQINPHFIFNTLNSALYFIDRKRFDEAYVHVQKFSKLLRAYLKSAQERFTLLHEEIDMLRNYIELQKSRFDKTFEYNIEVDNKLPVKSIKIPSLLLQPLVENAINHGLFHKSDEGLLMIRFLQGADNTELVCVIEDNGVGRQRAKEIKETSSIQKESYGTKLTQQLMDVFKEFEKLDISLSYEDKVYPETGTKVTVVIKNIKYEA